MPSYRSDAEAEVRGAVVEHLRRTRPKARIIHEINACGFGNRIDVLAVSCDEIIAVEVKSKKDKLDRLPAQVKAMRGAAHRVIAALHEKFLCDVGGGFFPPEEARGAVVWAFPRTERRGHIECSNNWLEHDARHKAMLPSTAINMLWRDELRLFCNEAGIAASSRSTMPEMIDAIQWHCSGAELTRGICRSLRRRECVEADPAITNWADV